MILWSTIEWSMITLWGFENTSNRLDHVLIPENEIFPRKLVLRLGEAYLRGCLEIRNQPLPIRINRRQNLSEGDQRMNLAGNENRIGGIDGLGHGEISYGQNTRSGDLVCQV
jgi:hypothetical protein